MAIPVNTDTGWIQYTITAGQLTSAIGKNIYIQLYAEQGPQYSVYNSSNIFYYSGNISIYMRVTNTFTGVYNTFIYFDNIMVFKDGRNRFANMRDMGVKFMYIEIDRDDIDKVRPFEYNEQLYR